MEDLTHIALFAGIGGDSLAAKWAGFRQVLFVEIDEFCQKVLRKHWPDVPIIGDIRDATKERIREVTGTETVDLITGGFPCQPFSVAGKRRGKADDRYLWPEMFRVIKDIMPRWVVAENVHGILNLQQGDIFNQVLADLEGEGYETLTVVLPACAVNAPHRRNRVFIIANSQQSSDRGKGKCDEIEQPKTERPTSRFSRPDCNVTNTQSSADRVNQTKQERRSNNSGQVKRDAPNSDIKGLAEREKQVMLEQCSTAKRDNQSIADPDPGGEQQQEGYIAKGGRWYSYESWNSNWIEVATRFCRVDDRIPDRIHRLKALGNAIVPQQLYPILKAIAMIETAPEN